MQEIIFWGATGQAKVLNDAIQGTDIKLAVLVDNRELYPDLLGVPVLRGEPGLHAWLAAQQRDASAFLFAVAVGGGRGRDRLILMDLLQNKGMSPLTIAHRTSFVAHDAIVGDGCQILAQSAICSHARLGRGVIVNTAASVDHDCEIGDGVHLAPGARLAGEVVIGKCTFVGTGAIVLPGICIGEDATVGAGAVVLKDVEPGTTVVGNPARVLSRK